MYFYDDVVVNFCSRARDSFLQSLAQTANTTDNTVQFHQYSIDTTSCSDRGRAIALTTKSNNDIIRVRLMYYLDKFKIQVVLNFDVNGCSFVFIIAIGY